MEHRRTRYGCPAKSLTICLEKGETARRVRQRIGVVVD
jgi:hypothetical protein